MMLKKIAVLFLAVSLTGLPQVRAQEDFNTQLQGMFLNAAQGKLQEAEKTFQDLVGRNPTEWIIYDAYVNGLIQSNHLQKAIEACDLAMTHRDTMNSEQLDAYETLRGELEAHIYFQEERAGFPDWDQAEVLGTQEFVIKTNLPETYYRPLAEKLSELMTLVQDELIGILGEIRDIAEPLELWVIPKPEEYENLVFERATENRDTQFGNIYFDELENRMYVHYRTDVPWSELAYTLGLFLIKQKYSDSTSLFFQDGLARSLAVRLEKERSKLYILAELEYFNWRYDQGEVKGVQDLFDFWRGFRSAQRSEIAWENMAAYARGFHFHAWMLTQFFLQTDSERFQTFYRHYIQYELSEGHKEHVDIELYFEENLSAEEYKELNTAWLDYLLNLTYEKI